MERLSLFWKIVILFVVVIGFTLVSPQRIPPSRSNVDTSNLLDIKPHELQKFVSSGSGLKLLYFYTNERPTNPEFVEELNKAAAHLHTQKYGVKVAKVDCREHGLSFCKEKSIQSNVFALRAGKKISLPMDTLQDRHGIIASVLHIAMIDKIPILKSVTERQDLEDKCKGRCNILFMFLKELGSYEHRVFMETAMRVSDKYLCALTTDYDTTLGLSEPDLQNDGENHGKTEKEPKLWALQCSNVEPQSGHSCLQAVHWMRIDLTSVNVFLQAVDMEPWVEVKPSSDRIRTEYDNLELPKVFLTYDKNEKEQVINIANQLNTLYRGALGICIIDRTLINKNHLKSLGLNEIIYPPGVMFLQPDDTRVAVLSGYQDSFNFIREQLQQYYTGVLNNMNSATYDEESFDEEYFLLNQDDPVALTLRRIGDPNVTNIRAFTDKTMPNLLEDLPVAMVIFYVDWDPESLIVLHMFARLAVRFEGELNLLARVNCFDWTDICHNHNITQYPTIRLYQKEKQPITYKGMFDENMLWNTLLIFKQGSSVKLETDKEVETFMKGEEPFQFTRNLNVIILGGFSNYSCEALGIYRQVGEELRGQFPFASVVGDVAEAVGRKYSVSIPFVMVTRRNDKQKNVTVVSWDFSDCTSLEKFIQEESVPIFPEVNDLTYVALRQLNRPLAILVGSTAQILREEQIFSKLAFEQRQLKQISLSWLDSESDVGVAFLKNYNVTQKEILPVLTVINYKENVFYMHPNNSYSNEELENWFSLVSNSQIEITGHLPEGKWKPLQPDFNYLKRMEQEAVNIREHTGMDKYERREDSMEAKDDSYSSARVQVSDDTDIFLQQTPDPVTETFTTSRQAQETEGPTDFSSHMEL